MGVTVTQFVEKLVRSRLMSAEEAEAFRTGTDATSSAEDLARALVRAGKLTKYQVKEIWQGHGDSLAMGEYVILDEIGAGGMGKVLKAQHRRMERIVALKVLSSKLVDSPEALKRFQREVKAAARLEHPNIVTAYDAGESKGTHYLVMQYVRGTDLSHIIKQKGLFTVEQAVDCTIQAARGLEYAHSQGVIHRDIKPGNLLLDEKGTVKILDMGLARIERQLGADGGGADDEKLTSTGMAMGTCDYMAPEQAEDTHAADHRADIYSLGCTLYRLLTGKPPYKGDTHVKVILGHIRDPIPSLRTLRLDVPEELDAVFQKMLAKRPEDRYQSMTTVIEALQEAVAPVSDTSRVRAGRDPSDAALTSFLENLGKPAARVVVPLAAEETMRSRVELETGVLGRISAVVKRRWQMHLVVGGLGMLTAIMAATAFFGIDTDPSGQSLEKPGSTTPEDRAATSLPAVPVQSADPKDTGASESSDSITTVAKSSSADGLESWITGWNDPVNLGPPINSSAKEAGPHLSADGLTLYFYSDRPGGLGDDDLWMSMRDSQDGAFGNPINLGPPVNTSSRESRPSLTADERFLFFSSNRPGGYGGEDLWVCRRNSIKEAFSEPINLGAAVNTEEDELSPAISSDGLELVFHAKRAGTRGSSDLWSSGRNSMSEAFSEPVNLGPPVNSEAADGHPTLSADGLSLLFASNRAGAMEVWQCRRASRGGPFAEPEGLTQINRGGSVWHCSPSADDLLLIFDSDRPGGQGGKDLWVCRRDVNEPRKVREFQTRRRSSSDAPPPAVAPFDAAQAKKHQQAWAEHLRVNVEITNSIGMKLVLIPPGEFDMGSPDADSVAYTTEKPQHRVRITKPFLLGRHEVTVGQFQQFIQDANYKTDVEKDGIGGMTYNAEGKPERKPEYNWRHSGFSQTDDHPVLNVSWNDALNFCQWLSRKESQTYRLPTEAEWEYACRAGTTTRYHNGDDREGVAQTGNVLDASFQAKFPESARTIETTAIPVSASDGNVFTAIVGQFRPNAFGLYDMLGNAWELCADAYDKSYYAVSPATDPSGPPSGEERLVRGGSWATVSRCAVRINVRPLAGSCYMSFRVARAVVSGEQLAQDDSSTAKRAEGVKPTQEADTVPGRALLSDASSSPPLAIAPFDAAQARKHQEAWAAYLKLPVEETNSIDMKLIVIPPGEFDMGSSESPEELVKVLAQNKANPEDFRQEQPQHRVRISKAFYLGQHEVTVGQFRRFVEDASYKTEAERDGRGGSGWNASERKFERAVAKYTWRNTGFFQDDNHPVVNVSWNDVMEFCKWLSRMEKRTYRLPTEAEWEYACRAGSTTTWWFGDDESRLGDHAWYGSNSDGATHPVGQKQPNPWSLYEIYGNVYERCADWYEESYYATSPSVDPIGPPSGTKRVARGGSLGGSPVYVRSAYRGMGTSPDQRDVGTGFRIARTP
ncbi:MAG: SUMF1/EgtB/PvdO family nonheme iron enzyme [Rhodopirellula sp.]|nr:SUMF1/EgtB/PvdO family nonheme iron enzyme [Rhodopirellula sp.]